MLITQNLPTDKCLSTILVYYTCVAYQKMAEQSEAVCGIQVIIYILHAVIMGFASQKFLVLPQ